MYHKSKLKKLINRSISSGKKSKSAVDPGYLSTPRLKKINAYKKDDSQVIAQASITETYEKSHLSPKRVNDGMEGFSPRDSIDSKQFYYKDKSSVMINN